MAKTVEKIFEAYGKDYTRRETGIVMGGEHLSLEQASEALEELIKTEVIGEKVDLKKWNPSHKPVPDQETAMQMRAKDRHNELLAEQLTNLTKVMKG